MGHKAVANAVRVCDGSCVVQGVCKRRCLESQRWKCWCDGKPDKTDFLTSAHNLCHGGHSTDFMMQVPPYLLNSALYSTNVWCIYAAFRGTGMFASYPMLPVGMVSDSTEHIGWGRSLFLGAQCTPPGLVFGKAGALQRAGGKIMVLQVGRSC